MNKLLFLLCSITLLFISCQSEKEFIEIPHRSVTPFFATDFLDAPLHHYIKEHRIKSIGIKYATKNVDESLLFDKDGFIQFKTDQPLVRTEYFYDENRLVKIIKPINVFSIVDAEYLEFEYDKDNRIIKAKAYIKDCLCNPLVDFNYYKDSTEIISYDSLPQYWIEKTIFIKTENGKVIKEKYYKFNKLAHNIIYKYSNQGTLTTKEWFDKDGKILHVDHYEKDLIKMTIGPFGDTCHFNFGDDGVFSSCYDNMVYMKAY